MGGKNYEWPLARPNLGVHVVVGLEKRASPLKAESQGHDCSVRPTGSQLSIAIQYKQLSDHKDLRGIQRKCTPTMGNQAANKRMLSWRISDEK